MHKTVFFWPLLEHDLGQDTSMVNHSDESRVCVVRVRRQSLWKQTAWASIWEQVTRSMDSAYSCGWVLLVLSKDDLDFGGTSYLPACGTGKEIELLWDEVDRNGVMVIVLAGSCCRRAGGSPWSRSQMDRREWMGWEQVHRCIPGAGVHSVQVEDGGTALLQPREGEALWLSANTWYLLSGRRGRKHCPSLALGPILLGWDRWSPFHPNWC